MCMAAVGLIGAGISAAGGIMGANAQADSYEQKSNEYLYNAMLKQRQAVIEQQAGQFKQRRMMEKAQGVTGEQIANYAAGGVTLDGSPTDVITDSRREALLDIGAIKFETDMKDTNLMNEARMSHYNATLAKHAASQTRKMAPLAAIAPMLNGLTSLGGSF